MRRETQATELSQQAYRRAADYLADLDEDWARHVAATGPCQHEPKPTREPFEALVRAVAYQQLHARAGDAILGRLLALYPDKKFPSAGLLLATDPELQRACGFSVIERLVSLRGVGRWTAEMFLIYSLERIDVLPVDDFGVREGYRRLKGWDRAPTPRQMREIGKAWSPYRTVAAWYLWRSPTR